MLDREQTFKVTRAMHDSQNNNLIFAGLIEDKMLTKARDGYAAKATQFGSLKATR